MARVLTRCPLCESTLHVSELVCAHCGASIRSRFETCRFCRLAPEHHAFLELFLRNEGNLSRVGIELGLSYPTVRNKLSTALAALGFDEPETENAANGSSRLSAPIMTSSAKGHQPEPPTSEMLERRRRVLENLSLGTISVEEAADALRYL